MVVKASNAIYHNNKDLLLNLLSISIPNINFEADFLFSMTLLQIVGALWYLLGMERNDACWQRVCNNNHKSCTTNFLYCDNQQSQGYDSWSKMSVSLLNATCSGKDDDDDGFDFGIFKQALTSSIFSSSNFISKYCYCLWWGLQNLR